LRIGLLDHRCQLSAAAPRPGTVTVVATDAGSAAHDAVLNRDGRRIGGSRVLAPGGGLVSADEYRSLKETVYLLQSPRNAQRLRESLADVAAGSVEPHDLAG
jgi:PHD/YefM family antitoxin component YafN of YafNO toxin-antitoxin module